MDIFSLGIIIFEIFTGKHPFGNTQQKQESNIKSNKPELQSNCRELDDLVRKMICKSPKNRITAKQVLDHPFFWTDNQKLEYICDFSDIIALNIEGFESFVNSTINCYDGWYKKFDDRLIERYSNQNLQYFSKFSTLIRLV